MCEFSNKFIILIILSNIAIFSSLFFHSKVYSLNKKVNLYRDKYLELMAEVVSTEVYTDDKSMTMITKDRLSNVRELIELIIKNHVKGDVVECGTWRGGAMAYARSVLNIYNETERIVHLFTHLLDFHAYPIQNMNMKEIGVKISI